MKFNLLILTFKVGIIFELVLKIYHKLNDNTTLIGLHNLVVDKEPWNRKVICEITYNLQCFCRENIYSCIVC